MKVLMVAQHVNFFRNLETVIRELCRRGHEVVFLHGVDLDDPRATKKVARKIQRGKLVLTRGLETTESEIAGVTSGHRPIPADPSCRALRFGRRVMNRATYLRKHHPSPARVVDVLERDMPPRLAAAITRAPWKYVLRRPASMKVWRRIEDASPPSPALVSLLTDINPQVMLVSPTVWPKDLVEADYLHAARSIGIPTLGCVNSWDNLTSKGTVHVLPDQFMVWNEPIAREAVELHQVPREIIRITGAPHLDHFFAMRATKTRDEMCVEMGCPADRPYVVYLCSSRTLVASEVDLATRLATELARQRPDRTPTLVVRPHPTNPAPWTDYEHPGVVVYPRGGDQADSVDSWQQYFNQLACGSGAFGLNSTAFLEAVVAGRPCVTIVAEEFWASQGRTGHFRHVLEGDFLEVASDVAGAAERLVRILDGADEKRDQRLEFARSFLRPCGLDRPAAQVVADVIEQSALPCSSAGVAHAVKPVPWSAIATRALPLLTEWATWLAADEARQKIAAHVSFLRTKHGTALKGRMLFVAPDPTAFVVLRGLLNHLSREGHDVHMAIADVSPDDPDLSSLQGVYSGLTVGRPPDLHPSPWRPLADALRECLDGWRLLVAAGGGVRAFETAIQHASPLGATLARNRLLRTRPVRGVASRAMASIERALPLELALIGFLDDHKPDVIIVLPHRSAQSAEADYVRAARWLGVRSIYLPLRWDDLESSTGLSYATPDAIALWNEAQRREVVNDYRCPADRVHVTGALLPSDSVDGTPRPERDAYCARMGIDRSRRIILFEAPAVSTRASIASFHEWRRMVKESTDPDVRRAAVVVFVHRQEDVASWRRLASAAEISVARASDDERRALVRLNESLRAADVVVAADLTTVLEASALAKPVIVLLDEVEGSDTELARFCRVYSAAYASPIVVRSLQEATAQLALVLGAETNPRDPDRAAAVRADPDETGALRVYRLLDELARREETNEPPTPPPAWKRLLVLCCATRARRASL